MYQALQTTNTQNSKQIFPDTELRGHSPIFHIHVSVGDLYIPKIDLPIQEYLIGIFVAVSILSYIFLFVFIL